MEGRNRELAGSAEVLEGDANGSGSEGFEAVDHGRRKRREVQGDCVMKLSGKRDSRNAARKEEQDSHANIRSRSEDVDESAGSKGENNKE